MEEVPLRVALHEGDFDLDEREYLLPPTEQDVRDSYKPHYTKKQRGCFGLSFCRLCQWIWRKCRRQRELKARNIIIGQVSPEKFPPNVIRNQKYNVITFLPLVLFQQFKFFLNLYFLIMATSQFIPDIRIGYLYTYWGPLSFVLAVTIFREAVDDYRRYRRDREVNCQLYRRLARAGSVGGSSGTGTAVASLAVPASRLRVGDLVVVEKGQRVPADLVLLRTTERSGACFVRTDQLDGETDWKLRLAVPATQKLASDADVFSLGGQVYAERPQKDIHGFVGTFTRSDGGGGEESLDVENTLWANCVVASGSALGVVVYTGSETRSVMNNSQPRSKVGLLDMEINQLTKVLFCAVIGLTLVMMCLKGFSGPWYRYMFRFILLFSYIIPISLRVNLDMGKAFYSWSIQRDPEIAGTVVRSTTIPEELGRISYLLTDKTGTLTQNQMILKKLHLGTVSYGAETFDEVAAHLKTAHSQSQSLQTPESGGATTPSPLRLTTGSTTTPASISISSAATSAKLRRSEVTRVQYFPSPAGGFVRVGIMYFVQKSKENQSLVKPPACKWKQRNIIKKEAVKAVALCHNVTPVYEGHSGSMGDGESTEESHETEADQHSRQNVVYQASSPDEVALVKWTEEVGLALVRRDLVSMHLRTPTGAVLSYTILQIFPFTSETKRMGVIVKEEQSGEIVFYLKGADVVMSGIVQYNDWLEEECDNMAREGFRTLVVAKKSLTEEQYLDFETRYNAARMSVSDRGVRVAAVVESLEREMELLCVTGVEDRLQEGVRPTLEVLRNAGIKIWMLTGDKLETATCIAKSSRLVSRTQGMHIFRPVTTRTDAHLELNAFRKKQDCALVITGDSLEVCLRYYEQELMELACASPGVVCCRCSPTQKAQVARLVRARAHGGGWSPGGGGVSVSGANGEGGVSGGSGSRSGGGRWRGAVAAVGDGGNDVSMIQAADAGIGIAGSEGRQASLAADFSVTQFRYLARLLLVHGRRSYKRSASLGQFVIHRGLVISTMQAVFSSVFYFSSVALYQGFLMVGYATLYTMFPVFSLVLDKDVSGKIALTYPELYKELSKGRSLSFKTFFMWVLISIYQGGVIMYGALVLFEDEFIHIVAISFSSLVLTELIMVALNVRTWHHLMVLAELLSLGLYVLSLVLLKDYFDAEFIQTTDFLWKVLVITLVSCLPLYILKFLRKKFSPPSYSKLS